MHLKHTAWANKLYMTLEALQHAVTQVLEKQNEPTCWSNLLAFVRPNFLDDKGCDGMKVFRN